MRRLALASVVLLAIAWIRRKRHSARRHPQRDPEDAAERERRAARLRPIVVAPPAYVQWPGEDPFADDRPDPTTPPDPKLLN